MIGYNDVIVAGGIAALLLVLIAGPVKADDSKYCGLMIDIYGVCSPELIANYLNHLNKATPIQELPKVKPAGTDPGEDKTIITPRQNLTVDTRETPAAPNLVNPCYKGIDNCTRCAKDGKVISITCPVPQAEPWFKNRIWLVS